MRHALDTEDLIRQMSLDRLLALVVAHEDVQRMAADPDLPESWFDTVSMPPSPTVPAMRKAA